MDMDMVKDGLNRTAVKMVGGSALVLSLVGLTWVGRARALPVDNGPALQAGAKTSAPSSSAKKMAPAQKQASSKAVAKQAAAKPSGPEKGPAAEVTGKRDPFKLPPPPVPGQAGMEQILGPLPPGTRGLVISRLRVQGIVRLDTTNTMIAVVDNNTNRAYFLRENDVVYNGVVSKITPDSVIFRENTLDQNGRVETREVVKRLGQAPGA
jgi:hypothetical protein